MEHVTKNDGDQVYRLMANYNFDKAIKGSIIFEDDDLDETDLVQKNSPLSENELGFPLNNNNIYPTAELLDRNKSDYILPKNLSFANMENFYNNENEILNKAEENVKGMLQNQFTVNSYPMLNHLRDIQNFTDRTVKELMDYKCINRLTSNDKAQFLQLLDTLSENVIMAAQYYNYYIYEKSYDQIAMQNFLDHSVHYYNKSYCLLIKVLLPLESNHVFISKFIQRTFDIASSKSYYHHLHIKSLEFIVLDMIKWAKRKKEWCHLSIDQSRCPMRIPPAASLQSQPCTVTSGNMGQILNTQVSRGPSILTSVSYSNSNDTRQLMSGPSISQAPFNLPKQSTSHNTWNINIQQPTWESASISVPTSLNPASNSFSNVGIRQPNNGPPVPSNLSVPGLSKPNIKRYQSKKLPPRVSHKPSVVSAPQGSYVDTRHPVTRESMFILPEQSASHIITCTGKNKGTPAVQDNTVCLFSTGPPGNNISISIDASIVNKINELNLKNGVHQTSNKQTCKRRKKNNTESSPLVSTSSTWIPALQNQFQQNNQNYRSPNHTPITYSNADNGITTMPVVNNRNQLYPGERLNHKEYDSYESFSPLLKRSESRDSGLGSPVLSALPCNDYNTGLPDNQQSSPEITHVTSLNPGAVLIEGGACKICGTTTRNKCLACFKVYYCTTKCQKIDWPLHKLECRGN